MWLARCGSALSVGRARIGVGAVQSGCLIACPWSSAPRHRPWAARPRRSTWWSLPVFIHSQLTFLREDRLCREQGCLRGRHKPSHEVSSQVGPYLCLRRSFLKAASWGRSRRDSPSGEVRTFKLAKGGAKLHFCYEAGPTGCDLHRQIIGLGHDGVVVAPSLGPRRPGDRVKTNRRDAVSLARLHRAGELTAVWVPDAAHEAMRDLVRALRGCARRAEANSPAAPVLPAASRTGSTPVASHGRVPISGGWRSRRSPNRPIILSWQNIVRRSRMLKSVANG
jgi:hypothetical protein